MHVWCNKLSCPTFWKEEDEGCFITGGGGRGGGGRSREIYHMYFLMQLKFNENLCNLNYLLLNFLAFNFTPQYFCAAAKWFP